MNPFLPAALLFAATASLGAQLPALGTPRRLAPQLDLGRVDYAAIAPDGSAVLVDGENYRLYRLTSAGEVRDSLGAKGAGPGEFRAAAGVALGPAGEIALADIGLRRVVIWDASRRPVAHVSIPAGTPLAMAGWDAGAVVVVGDFTSSLRLLRAGEGLPLIATVPATMAPPSDAAGCMQCPVLMLPGGRTLVAATEDSTYRLLEFDRRGHVAARWTAPPIAARRRTDDELADLSVRMMRGPGGGRANPEGRSQAPDLERYRYPRRIAALARDGAGRVWVQAAHAGPAATTFDVYGVGGKYLGSVRVREPLRSFDVSGKVLIGWGETADGEPAAWRYDIR